VVSRTGLPALALLVAFAFVSGCASAPPAEPPSGGAAPASPAAPAPPAGGFQNIMSGASDSAAAAPGSATALYRYRFEQTLPGSERFTFQDRDLSFYFKPAPDALYLQVENRKDQPVWIDWDRCVFYDPTGRGGQIAHATTSWADRLSRQTPTQIAGLQRYSDYLLPLDYLVDPAGSTQQLHRPLLPEDSTAPQFADKAFGVDLVFRIDSQPRTYPFRFRVASVLPK
jgi:hypothetical protein